MADIKDRIDGLIKAMRDLAEESAISESDLKKFVTVLETLGGGTGQFAPKMSKIATAIEEMSTALAGVGASESYVNRLKISLMELAKSYERTGAASQKMQSLKGLGLVGREEGMAAFRREEAIQAAYFQKALVSTTTRPLTPGIDIESQIGARATSLRLADDMQKKLLQQAVAEKQVTLEIQAQTAAREAQRLAFMDQPGLGQRYAKIIEARQPAAPITPEQIRIDQDAQYEALKQEAITPRRQLFDPSTQEAEREAEAIRRLAMEVQKLEEAYSKTYSGRLQAGREKALQQAEREAALVKLTREGKEAKGTQVRPLREALVPFEGFIPGGEVGIENLQAKLEGLGVTQVNNVRASRELSNGITTMSVSMTEASGALTRGTVHMDKYGNVLRDTSRRFRSFSDAIGTNIVKVTQWAVATGLVYGAVRQLGQVFKEITEIQSKLAHVQIALGQSQGDLNQVFEEALNVANLTSSTVAGVVEAYAVAYRATGSYAAEAERLAVTNNLLQESMILSKLAGIDQANSLDILVGALRQTGRELDQGRELLDKWVLVSRQANVSLDTLAQTYSIVGSTAQGVGIQMEELNALTATLAEATNLSATETGNALRGIISGFQSATSEKTLARFGLATRDATGQIRDFMDLYLELAQLTQSGILSDRDISEIAQAVGGGYRRAAQVETLFKNASRVQQITALQADAGGSAAEALEIQMATLESAITRLGNAFTKFAQSLGDEGGFLGTVTKIVDGMSGLLNVITELIGGMGKMTPAILAFAAAWAVLGSAKGQDLLKGLIGKEITGVGAGLLGRAGIGPSLAEQQMMQARAGGYYAMQPAAPMTVGGAFTGARGGVQSKIGVDPMGLIVPALIAAGAFGGAAKMRKEDPVGAGLEAGRGISSVIGAIVGGIVTAGSPLGIAAGSVMASSFYKAVVQYEDDLAGWWQEILRKGDDPDRDDEEAAEAIEDSFKIGARAYAGLTSIIGNAATFLASGRWGDMDARAFMTGMVQQREGRERFGRPEEGDRPGIMEAPFMLFADLLLSDATVEEVSEKLNEALAIDEIDTGIADAMAQDIKRLKPILGPVIEEFMAEAQRELVLGDLTLQEFIKLPQDIDTTKLATQMAKITTAADFAGMSIDVKDFAGFILQLDETTRNYVGVLADDVVNAYKKWQTEIIENRGDLEKLAEVEADYYEKRGRYQQMIPAVRQQFELQEIDRPQVFQAGRMSQAQVAMAAKAAQAYTKSYYMEITKGNEEQANLMISQLEDFLIQHGEGIGASFGATIGGTTIAAMTQAIKDYNFESLLQDVDFGFQDLRDSMSMGDIPDLMSRYQKVVGTFQTFFPDYDVEEENVGLITKDGLTTVHADLTLLNLAMQDLIDVNEQQLEGVWNIPAGMTAMVAWSSLFSRDVGGGGGFADGDVFTEERKDEAVEPVSVLEGLEAKLAQLDATIAGYQALLEMGPKELGMQEFLASQQDLVGLTSEREDLLQQIALTQLGQGLGITPVGDVSVAEQLREALTIQNKIELNANIRLVVDGRTLASIVKQYLFEDLVSAADKTTGTGSGDYVIGH